MMVVASCHRPLLRAARPRRLAAAALVLLALWLPRLAAASPAPWFTCGNGDGPQQLCWLVEGNGVLDGPFQGPMAFACDRQGNLWAGDTLNARIVVFDPQGRARRQIDLLAAGKAAGLASDPVLADFVPATGATLLVADAANNCVLVLDLAGRLRRVLRPGAQADWLQINRLHADAAGRLYLEDAARARTLVLDGEGRQLAALEGVLGIAVSPRGLVFQLGESDDPLARPVLAITTLGKAPRPFARLTADAPITWAAPLGVDARGLLHVIADTADSRHLVAFDLQGREAARKRLPRPDPGYDPTRPEWLAPDGSVHHVVLDATHLRVLRAE